MYILATLWRGERSLAATFWGWSILSAIILWILIFPAVFLSIAIGSRFPLFVWIALSLIQGVFMLVAVWRSAGNYMGPRIWTVLARINCVAQVFFILKTVLDLASGSGDFQEILSVVGNP